MDIQRTYTEARAHLSGLLDRVDGLIAVLVAVGLVRLIVGETWPWT